MCVLYVRHTFLGLFVEAFTFCKNAKESLVCVSVGGQQSQLPGH